ncbi:AAA family ATPase [Bacillus cereus group sp. RP43]|uniref:AAA family ATPase n=1 Tax=Bacillus cereus group sp. RP43 TaxID=3040260 RepID=UPI003399925D
MSDYIRDIILYDKKYYIYSFDEDSNGISNLSKINIFVGSNNSGKSKMLRNLFIEKPLLFKINNIDLEKIKHYKDEFKQRAEVIINSRDILDYKDILSDTKEFEDLSYITEGQEHIPKFYYMIDDLIKSYNQGRIISEKVGDSYIIDDKKIVNEFDYTSINNELKKLAEEIKEKLGYPIPENFIFKKVYIPTLRGLRILEKNDDLYFKRTKEDYFEEKEQIDIFTGLNLYEEVRDLLLGSFEEREKIADFQKFLGSTFFDGQRVTLVPKKDSKVLFVKIGEEKEYPIHMVGDGIQSIIIMTFPIFKYKDEKLLMFIEEPELFLHPGLQRKLLEAMANESNSSVQYFITTHSNHFLDLTLDIDRISIYLFSKELENSQKKEKEAKFIVENVSNEDNNVLEILGVRNSSVFLSNCTIWVEGITDRYYLRHFLKVYINSLNKGLEFKEDFHYSFVEYSGNNITHWSFLDEEGSDVESSYSSINVDRLCSRLFLISDKDSEGKLPRQEKLREKLKDRFYCLECREIENILSKQVLLKVIADYEKVEEEELDLEFKKVFTEENYRNEYLGEFIEDKLPKKNRKGSYSYGPGTINEKQSFCKKAISKINSIEDLSSEAIKLCEKIYKFIKDNNS